MTSHHQSKLFEFKHNLPLMFTYAIVFAGLWWLSKQLEIIPGAVSWFLPAGIRLAALALTPRKRWWHLWLAEIFSSAFLIREDFEFSGLISAIAAAALPLPVYAIALLISALIMRQNNTDRIGHFPTLAAAAISGACASSIVYTSNLIYNGVATVGQTASFFLSISLGDLVGTSLSLPLIILATHDNLSWRTPALVAGLGGAAVLVAAVSDIGPYRYYWRIAMLIWVAIAAQRFGLSGACVSSFGTAVIILASQVFDSNLGTMAENQLAIIFVTLGGLALGYSVDNQASLAHELARRNKELNRLNLDNQQLASRLVDASENERNAIARELHDGLGQMLASMRIKLQLLRVSATSDLALVDDLDNLLGSTYETARVLMNQLTPAALTDLGLEEALRASDITGLCRQAGTHCTFDIRLPQPLSQTLQLQLFRIIQEAAHNCAKHAQATHLVISVRVQSEELIVHIMDNGTGFDQHNSVLGRGLSNIRDRAALINAQYALTTSSIGTEHQLRLDFKAGA